MSRYDLKVALTTLSEQDKNRLLACYFSMENPNSIVKTITSSEAEK